MGQNDLMADGSPPIAAGGAGAATAESVVEPATDVKPRRVTRWPGGRLLSTGHEIYWWVEIIAVLTYYFVYSAVRNADAAHPERAFQHAKQLIGWQKSLGIYHELAIHKWARNIEPLIIAARSRGSKIRIIETRTR